MSLIRSTGPMGGQRQFTAILLVLATLMKSSYECCPGKPVFEDFYYTRSTQMGILTWSPPQSCGTVSRYEVLLAQAVCSASEAIAERVRRNENNITLTSSVVYCIQITAVINETCHSHNSTCAQVASLEQDQLFSVMMNGELCIPVTLCQQQHPSKILFFNSREHLHLTWRALQRRDNVNLTYSSSADTVYLCFANVNESFVIVEYCEVRRAQLCESGSIFCCTNWAEFVSRTSVNVAGGGSGGSLPTPCIICNDRAATMHIMVPHEPTLNFITEYDSSGLIRITSQIYLQESDLNSSIINYTFTYNDGSGSPPTIVVPSSICSSGVCEHVFYILTSSAPPFYTVSVTATNVAGEGPAITSQPIRTDTSDLQAVILPNNTVQCVLVGQPAHDCSILYGNDPTDYNLHNTNSAVAGGWIILTSKLTGNTTFYIVSTTIGSLTMRFHGSFTTCTAGDLMVSNLTVQSAQFGCSETSGDDPLLCYSGVTPGSTVVYHCPNSSFERLPREFIRQCQSDGTWSGITPSCVQNASSTLAVTVEASFNPSVLTGYIQESEFYKSKRGAVTDIPYQSFQNSVIGAGVGSAAAVFLLVIFVALIIGIAVVKSQKKGKREEPYYSVVNIKRPDAIEMKQNDAYENPPQLPLHVEENPAYSIGIQESRT